MSITVATELRWQCDRNDRNSDDDETTLPLTTMSVATTATTTMSTDDEQRLWHCCFAARADARSVREAVADAAVLPQEAGPSVPYLVAHKHQK